MNSENLKRILFTVILSSLAPSLAMAADLENGERIFSANCSACHAGGNNVIIPEKTLKKEERRIHRRREERRQHLFGS
jgi:cytochrome c6